MRDYIKKYPWLRVRNLYNGEIDSERDAWDDMPEGWKIAFGDMMLEELDAAIKANHLEDDFVIEQLKEKYGSLRVYTNVAHEDICNIIDKYEALSEHICIECGKPDVPILNMAWIEPMCEGCYNKHRGKSTKTYADLSGKEIEMPDSITFNGFKHGERYTRTLETKETAEKIRVAYKKRVGE